VTKCFFFADFFPYELKQMLNLSILFIEFSKVTAIMFFLTEYDFTFSFVKIMNHRFERVHLDASCQYKTIQQIDWQFLAGFGPAHRCK